MHCTTRRSTAAAGWGRTRVELVSAGSQVLTHCNTGGLATGGYGSALGAVRAAWDAGLVDHVWVDETRPLLQGARLTAWELDALGIPFAVIVDGAAASLIAAGEVDVVLTGADRIAANGDVANKIGTYGLALAANHHEIPFVVVAPTSTLDLAAETGADIPIEERDPSEVTTSFPARNPAFDVTPARFVSAIVTEVGVHRAPVRVVAADAVGVHVIDVDRETAVILERFGFDEPQFELLRARVATGELSPGVEPRPRVDRAAAPRGHHAATGARRAGVRWRRAKRDSMRCGAERSRRSCSPAAWRHASAASSRRPSPRSTARASSRRSSSRRPRSSGRPASRFPSR